MNRMTDAMIRKENARTHFIQILETCGLDTDAELVADFYIDTRLAKYKAGIGRYEVRHGALLGREYLEKAVKILKDEL
jgi:hypothetical protein